MRPSVSCLTPPNRLRKACLNLSSIAILNPCQSQRWCAIQSVSSSTYAESTPSSSRRHLNELPSCAFLYTFDLFKCLKAIIRLFSSAKINRCLFPCFTPTERDPPLVSSKKYSASSLPNIFSLSALNQKNNVVSAI